MKTKKHIPFYPLLISIYPILALMAFNLGEFDLSEGWRPLWISLIGTMILWLLLRIVVRDWEKSGLIATMFVGLFFSYGHIFNIIKKVRVGDFGFGQDRILLPLLVVFLFAGIYWTLKTIKDVTKFGTTLNWVSIFLLVVPTYQVISFGMKTRSAESEDNFLTLQISVNENDDSEMPDIYFIILDAYTRQDTLQTMYGYDNSEFVASVEDMGFYVAECSQSNYPETYYSLISTMNMEYVENSWGLSEITSDEKYASLLLNNNLRYFLEEQGYNIVAFESGAYWSEFKDADYYLSFEESSIKWLGDWAAVNVITDFEILLLETTLVRVLEDFDIFDSQFKVTEARYQNKRMIILYSLDQLRYVHNIPGPKFVFAHVLSPHRPFIFGPNGEELIPSDEPEDDFAYEEGYTNQVTFINSQILPALKSIIRESKTPPIIILQGDHGPSTSYGTSSEFRSTILNAYYLPGDGDMSLYPEFSPVNSFRVVLKHYFQADLDLLEDIHYDSLFTEDSDNFPIIQNVGPVCGE